LRIVQVSPRDQGGGAERVAWILYQAFQQLGHDSQLVVGTKQTVDPNIIEIPDTRFDGVLSGSVHAIANSLTPFHGHMKGAWRVSRFLTDIAQPRHTMAKQLGHEDFFFPASRQLLFDLAPDILHCHNLHAGFFDLRALSALSQQTPTLITLHDEWLLTGHCGYPITCERWRTGCGNCPDLTLYPKIKRDATARNWRVKQHIYQNSRLYIAAPSQWLLDTAKDSMLAEGMVEGRVIPYGVDLEIFKPAEQSATRERLGLPKDAKILLFSGAKFRNNPYKDYDTMRTAMALLDISQKTVFLTLGDDLPPEQINEFVTVQGVPFQTDLSVIAAYYQAADLYLHAAKADNFPNAILEALCCGLPVVATGVGGITEQVRHGVTGLVTPMEDAQAMAQATAELLQDEPRRKRMAQTAAEDATTRFAFNLQIQSYLSWYEEILRDKSLS